MIAPHLGPSVLEVGAGLGEFASQLTGLRRHLVTDVDPDAVAAMATRFADRPEVEALRLDLTQGVPDIGEPVSTVLAINVLEHIEDDRGALRRWRPGGARRSDRAVGARLPAAVRRLRPGRGPRAPLHPADPHLGLRGAPGSPRPGAPVNLLGGIAWWLTVRRGGVGPAARAPRADLRPLRGAGDSAFTERRYTPPFGQSVLGVATVPG